jgi:hypothetical protein
MRIVDPRIQEGWLVYTSPPPADVARVRAWRRSHPEFAPWTIEWFSVECAPDVVADDFDPVRGTGSAFLFRTRAAAERFGAREQVVASGVRPIQPVYYADVSRLRAPDFVRQECAARLRRVAEALARTPDAGRLDVSGVVFAPATDSGGAALEVALGAVDEIQAWARQQEALLVEEAEGAGF